jgi:acetyltransferase-like isoleucine patch superfamily enzyme
MSEPKKKRTSRNPPPERQGPEWHRRYPMPFAESIEGEAQVHYGAELDRCTIISPNGHVKIGASRLSQCVIIEPCTIGDDVVAVAAILQGTIGDRCHIEPHADIQGTLAENVTIGRGAKIEPDTTLAEDVTIGDMTVVHEWAEIDAGAKIGAQSDIGNHATVAAGAILPSRSVMRPGSYLSIPADARQGAEPEQFVRYQIVNMDPEPITDEYQESDGEPEFDEEGHVVDESDEHAQDSRNWESPALGHGERARPGDMARGDPELIQQDFHPGTARSWVLSKLGRIANLKSKDGRLTKKLVQEWRPDLLEHPVTKEVLRIAPPVTDEQLAEMSFESLSKASYDVYGGISFHSGQDRGWQMLGPKANDVFVFSVPEKVMRGAVKRLVEDSKPHGQWVERASGGWELQYPDPDRGGKLIAYGVVYYQTEPQNRERPWMPVVWPDGEGVSRDEYPTNDNFADLEKAKRVVENWVETHVEKFRPLMLPPLTWKDHAHEHFLNGPPPNGDTFGEVVRNQDHEPGSRTWNAYYFPGGYDSNEEAEHLPDFDDLEEAKRAVEQATKKNFVRGFARGKRGFNNAVSHAFSNTETWHPDRGVPRGIGWVRLLVYPPRTVVVVEIQSDRPWMKFGEKSPPWPTVEAELRDMYFETFAADALNFVVEWAFNNRYGEVLVLDHASRKRLGGSPPKSFYDDLPKKYTVSAPVPLISGPFDYIRLYDWVPKDLKVRRIVPNRGRR